MHNNQTSEIMTPRATLIEAMQDARDPTDALDRMLVAMAVLGLKVVPVEPDRQMWAAGGTAAVRMCDRHHDHISAAVYGAMIAAAPDVLGAGE